MIAPIYTKIMPFFGMIDLEILTSCTNIGATMHFLCGERCRRRLFFIENHGFCCERCRRRLFFVKNTISCRERCRRRLFWPNHATFWHDWAVSCHFSALSCNHATLCYSLHKGFSFLVDNVLERFAKIVERVCGAETQ